MRLSAAKQAAKLSVHNEGDAIPAEDLPHIFERFYRADKASYGLGLSIAKNIAEAMGGKISAESSPARGTVFTVLFGRL